MEPQFPKEITDDRPFAERLIGELIEGLRALIQLAFRLFIPALLVVMGLWAYDKYRAPKLMVVDVLAFDAAQKKALMKGEIDQEEALKRVETIKQTLASYPKNVVFLRKDMVIENGEELEFQFKR